MILLNSKFGKFTNTDESKTTDLYYTIISVDGINNYITINNHINIDDFDIMYDGVPMLLSDMSDSKVFQNIELLLSMKSCKLDFNEMTFKKLKRISYNEYFDRISVNLTWIFLTGLH